MPMTILPDPEELPDLEEWVDTGEAARFLTNEMRQPTSPGTLIKWRCKGGGPVFLRFSRRVRYRKSRLREFALSRISREMHSTSEVG
jgi:hypothetical protein